MAPSPRKRLRDEAGANSPHRAGAEERRVVVGTPDYLAPEAILGTGDGPEVDWVRTFLLFFFFSTR